MWQNLGFGFWSIVVDWGVHLIQDFGDVFLVRCSTRVPNLRFCFLLEAEQWSVEAKGVQKLRQPRGPTLRTRFLVDTVATATRLWGYFLTCFIFIVSKS